MKNPKTSFAALFTGASVTIIACITLALSAVFLISLKGIVYRQTKTYTADTTRLLQREITFLLNSHTSLLKQTARAAASLLTLSGEVPREELRDFLTQTAKTLPAISFLYYTANEKWNEPGGCFIITSDWVPEADYDQRDRPWFINAKRAGGVPAYSEPYMDVMKKVLTLALSMTVVDGEGNDLGVLAAEITLDSLEALIKRDGAEKAAYLVDETGLFITGPDKDAIMKRDFFTERGLERYRSQALSATGEDGFFGEDKAVFLYARVIPESKWALVLTLPVSEVFAEVDVFTVRLLIAALVLFMAAALSSALFTRKALIIPLQDIARAAQSLADMDFSMDIPALRSDELGVTQLALLKIRDSLRESVTEMKDHVAKITTDSQRLNTVIVESHDALSVINTSMETVQSKMRTQMDSVIMTSDSAAEIFENIDDLNQAVRNQASHITRSSAAIEEMVANIAAIRSVVANTDKTTETLSKSSERGHRMLLKLAEQLKRIEEQSATLQNANKTIADIAGQTNILAMNAAIEAAHAGESGKGFAVVAAEIRKLAELSGKESESISIEIKNMEKAIDQISAVSKDTVESMDTIFQEIKAMDTSFGTVNNAVEEQTAGGAQILTALKTIQDMTMQVQAEAGVIFERSNTIHQELTKLHAISEDVTGNINEVRDASRSISSFLQSAKEIALSELENSGFHGFLSDSVTSFP